MEGGGSGESQSGRLKNYVNTENSQVESIGAIVTSTYQTKQQNLMPNSPAEDSCVMNYSQLFAYQGEMEPFKEHPSTPGCLISLRNKPQQKQPIDNFQHQYLPKLLIIVYSNH